MSETIQYLLMDSVKKEWLNGQHTQNNCIFIYETNENWHTKIKKDIPHVIASKIESIRFIGR